MDIFKEYGTFIAAVIAAIVSLISLVSSKSIEKHIAYRKTLEDHIEELGYAIHTTLATSKILLKTKTDDSTNNWREKSNKAQRLLKELYVSLRYPLWGLTEGLRALTRLPDWMENAKKVPNYSEKLFLKGKKLGAELDRAIRNSYNYGRAPNYFEQIRVKKAVSELYKIYEEMNKGK